MDAARISRLLARGKLSAAHAKVMRQLVDNGVVDPASVEGVSRAVVRLWYVYAVQTPGTQAALAVALAGAGRSNHGWALALVEHAGDREWDGLRSALDAYMSKWNAVTSNRHVISALMWKWLDAAGALKEDDSALAEDVVPAVTVPAAAQNPSKLMDVVNMYAHAHKVATAHACRLVDEIAIENGWWKVGDHKRSAAFVLDFVVRRLCEDEYVEMQAVLDELVVDGVATRDAVSHALAAGEDGGAGTLVAVRGGSALTLRGVLDTTRRVFRTLSGLLAEEDAGGDEEVHELAPAGWHVLQQSGAESMLAHLNAEQRALVLRVARGKRVTTCCSRPGTGKTFSAKTLATFAARVCCLAPTHLALARMQQQVDHAEVAFLTVQSFVLREGRQPYHQADLVLVDESSMLTMHQMARILDTYWDTGARIVFLGDDKQLPCIGRGAAFRDVVAFFGDALNQRLELCMRTSAGIAAAADAILEARVPQATEDVVLVPCGDPLQALGTQVPVAAEVQLIVGENRHVTMLNKLVQTHLGRGGTSVRAKLDQVCFVGDSVRVVKNNLPLYTNGDVGLVRNIADAAPESGRKRPRKPVATLRITRATGDCIVDVPEFTLEPAYACTVHRVQGSEFDTVVVVLFGDMSRFQKIRQLVYTAVTRAKRKLYLVGALDVIKQLRDGNRQTLAQLLGADLVA